MRALIAGGGTGGHLFPALAVARALKAEAPGTDILFVGTVHGIEARILPGTEFPVRFVKARGIRKTGLFNKFLAGIELPLGVMQSISIIREFRPDFVLGVGGYASGPALAAAVILRIPNAIQEQNSVMGTTNRILARFVDRIFVSWEETSPATPKEKTVYTGNPVRTDLFEGNSPEKKPGVLDILVFGGSRGAKSINTAMTSNLGALGAEAQRIRVVHQTGQGAADEVRAAYKKAGVEADVREFINDMGPFYRLADLVVCRGGASSLAEIAAMAKPAIVVPYPYAIGDHQALNAGVMERAGAIKVIPDENLKNGTLLREIGKVLETPELLNSMSQQSLKFGKPQAAQTIAREILRGLRKPD
jgi:UDP-N-acetylglucosamine--N-acetylmuramyl-(pentapeptide) pyrophosphoryl-undecaprenol N-acetylglucosamine transferase